MTLSLAAQAATVCQSGVEALNPDADYTNNGDGTVTHNPTGLIWKRCLEGQTYSGSSCVGTPTTMNWVTALKLSTTTNFANQSDWRLPNIKELRSLVEECRTNPSINSNLFPNTPSVAHNVWSSTPKRTYFTDTFIWGVSFDAGGSYNDYSGNTLLVRLVRGGKPLASLGVPICTISADPPNNVISGSTVKLTANCSTGTTSYKLTTQTCTGATPDVCTETPISADPTQPTNFTVTPTVTTTYKLVGSNASGQSGVASNITISVAASSTGTYKDTATGLVWKNCLEGQTWDSGLATCTGTPAVYNLSQAATFNTSPITYAGISDWRMPTIRELMTLVDDTLISPATSSTLFPATPAYATLWTGSLGASATVAWYVAFNRGTAHLDGFAGSRAVRLVSGSSSLPLFSTSRPTTDYKDLGNGTVTHSPTNLMWQRCLIGQTWNGTTCTGSAELFTWSQASQMPSSNNFASYTDWRVPTQKELLSLVDYSVSNPAINSTIFPNNGNSVVWSKTAFAGNSSFQWLVSFANGDNLLNLPGDAYAVRLVRGSALPTTPISTSPTSMQPLVNAPITNAAQGSTVVSPSVMVTGVRVLTPISIVNGEYQINEGNWTSLAGAVKNGDVVKVRVTASAYPATTVRATLTIGSGATASVGNFDVSTSTVVNGTTALIGSTYTDPQTGLEWKRCAEGQTWLNGTCTGTASTHAFTDTAPVTNANTMVVDSVTGFNGKIDWRVPTIRELSTLVDYTVPNAAAKINNTLYPNTPNAMFWSSTSSVQTVNNGWYLYFFEGYGNDNESKTQAKYLRLVRGSLTTGILNAARPDADYDTNSGDGTVTHKPTGLMWQRCLAGQTWSGSSCTGTANVYSWVNAKAISNTFAAKTDWRLPTQKELLTLVDFAKTTAPAINTTIFSNDGGANVWSSTGFVDDTAQAMYVALSNGASYHQSVANALSVRLVRNGLLTDTNCLFNWAERLIPELLSPPNQTTQQMIQMGGNAIYHRYYPSTGVYVATDSSKLYAIGGSLGTSLLEVGLLTDFLPAATSASCR
jgi:hypothetical protein